MIEPSAVPASWCPRPAVGVVTMAVDDHVVLWGPAVKVPELLSPVDAVIWSFVDAATSVAAMADDIAAVFHATDEKALADVQGLLAWWTELGLVVDDAGLAGGDDHEAAPIAGPDAEDHPLQSPAVDANPAVNGLVRWHTLRKFSVRAGRLLFAISVEAADDIDLESSLRARLEAVIVEDDGRRRYAVLRQRDHADPADDRPEDQPEDPSEDRPEDRPEPTPKGGPAPSWLVLSDVGLPLERTTDAARVLDTVSRLVSEVIDRQTADGVAWFRLAAADRADGAILLQHELLYAHPGLVAGLTERGFDLRAADHVAIDPAGRVVRFTDRFAVALDRNPDVDGPPTIDTLTPVRGVVLVGGGPLGPVPDSDAARRWLLALYSCIGHDPRVDPWDGRWDTTAALAATVVEVVPAFDPASALAAIDRIVSN